MTSKISLQQFKGLFLVKGIFALLLAAPGVASAAATIDIKDTNYPIPSSAYFVSPDGKNTNSGKTANSPWPVAKAIASAPSGATIVFKGGTYHNFKAAIGKKLTLQAYPHEKPWLKGSVVVTGWVADGSIWRKDGWNYSFPLNLSSQYTDPDYPMARYGDMVYINGVSLKQVASSSAVKPGTFYVDSANNRLYIGNNPVGKTVEATAVKDGLSMWNSASYTVVRGLGFAHYADSAIRVQAPHVTLEKNTFVWNGMQGAGLTGTDALIRGNTFSYNGSKGLAGHVAHRMLLENNTISYNNIERFAQSWDAAGIKVVNTEDLIWRNNIVENNFATGMWVDESGMNAKIINNTIRNNEAMGIMFELSHLAIIAANVAYNNLIGIMVADSSNARVYNNTLSMNLKGITIKDSTRKNTNADGITAGITWTTRNNVVKNNIFSNATGKTLFEVSDCVTKQQSKLMVTAANHNAYYRKSSSKPASLITWSLGAGKCSVGYTSIGAFKSVTGFEANALSVDAVATNPFFVDEANGNYHLKSGSPAIGRGEPLPADIAKAIGLAAGVPVDLGALQSKTVVVQ